ncbi:MAG: DUF885 domain-containing protein [Gammaproteobacteria bacterium]|nr:DUF885 domain-containing protein [Pseudomonadales bacterium]
MKAILALLFLPLLVACGRENTDRPAPVSGAALPDSQLTETERLNVWLDAQFEEMLAFSPEFRTRLGDKTDYDQLDDRSEAAAERELDWRRNSVASMRQQFDYRALTPDGRLSWDLWEYNLELAEQGRPYWRHGYIFGRGGPHAGLPNFLINFHRVDSEADLRAYLSRLEQLPRAFDQLLERARLAADEGIRQPRFDYDFALEEIDRITSGQPFDGPGDSPLWADLQAKVSSLEDAQVLGADDASALLDQGRQLLTGPVAAAYTRVADWLRSDRDFSDEDARGVWNLPNGEDYYNYRLHLMTGLDLTADQIHEIGLAEVARLTAEMETIKRSVGFEGSLAEFFVYMRESDQFYYPNTDQGRQDYLQLARSYLDAMTARLPEYFGRLPLAGLEVRRVEAFREQDGAAQHYMPGAPDGSRPGAFYSHLSDMNAMPIYQLEDVAYHEGSPGHHMQISIQQELTDIPRFRTQSRNTAYTEGWGLYAEYLGKEMGFFQDPYSDFGRLTGEIWRAIRLVVDTGIHSKQWSEEQAVEYMLANSPLAEGAVHSEIQRYITGPGQATAYKIGMMQFLELREQASVALGDRFDIRDFHDLVLGAGALPMPILRQRVERWIQEQGD